MPFDALFVAQDSDCLKTTLRIVSGGTRSFGFLGAHGRRLANNEIITVPGHVSNHLGAGGNWDQREFRALERALQSKPPTLEILETPAVHLYDEPRGAIRILSFEAGVLGTVDPCWELNSLSSSSSAGT